MPMLDLDFKAWAVPGSSGAASAALLHVIYRDGNLKEYVCNGLWQQKAEKLISESGLQYSVAAA